MLSYKLLISYCSVVDQKASVWQLTWVQSHVGVCV